MDKDELLERYEAYGDESLYAEAKRLYERAVADGSGDAHLLNQYGYLQECHGRRSIGAAAAYYERAIAADPGWEKPHFHLISALTALRRTDALISRYRQRLAEAPADPGAHRLLALVYLRAYEYERAEQVVRAGLEIAPDDPSLIEQQGDIYAATGRPEDALACWRRAFTLAPDEYGISMRYSAAFLLEGQNRLAEAAQEWRFIVGWCEKRGYSIAADWPRRELARLEQALAG
jgi:tetratricopeptide (TPR) repeat protein